MMGLGPGIKWAAIAVIILALGFGLNKIHNIHLDIVEEAKLQAVNDFRNSLEDKVAEKEIVIKDITEEERAKLEAEAQKEREKVAELRRKLEDIEDIEELLQQQPDEVIERLNMEASEFYKDLEETTQ